MQVTIDQLRKVKGIGEKTIERIIEQYAEPSAYDTSYKPYKAHELDYCDENNWLMYGDCLERMREIPDGSVDMIMADVPYQTTSCHWDSMIPLEPMWALIKRVVKSNAAIVMTASQPFTTTLIASNMKMFKYCWVWEKTRASGHIHAKNKPMKIHEDVCVFSHGVTLHKGQSQHRMKYNPQGLVAVNKTSYRPSRGSRGSNVVAGLRPSHKKTVKVTHENYPVSVIKINSEHNVGAIHPTQKPVALLEYLIRTYTDEGDTVLDFTMGSGTTGVACRNLNRKFIGIELDENYYKLGRDRILNGDK